MSLPTYDVDVCDVTEITLSEDAPDPDFVLMDFGSLCVLTPETPEAHEWCAEHLPDDAMQWAGGTVIERRYVEGIADAIASDGLSVA